MNAANAKRTLDQAVSTDGAAPATPQGQIKAPTSPIRATWATVGAFFKGAGAPPSPPAPPVLPTEDDKSKAAPLVEVVNSDTEADAAKDVDVIADSATATEQLFREADIGHRARSPRREEKPKS